MFFSKVLLLDDIKGDSFIKEHILWDIEPKDLMEPRYVITEEGRKPREAVKGYIFYIDTIDKKPILFLMRHTPSGCAATAAQIDEIPQEMLAEAVEENKNRSYFSMYPINKKVEEWLKRELGVL